jgi:hypothetical protein
MSTLSSSSLSFGAGEVAEAPAAVTVSGRLSRRLVASCSGHSIALCLKKGGVSNEKMASKENGRATHEDINGKPEVAVNAAEYIEKASCHS